MKKAVFGAIFASLLMLSLPVVSTVNAGPQLIAKDSSERYVPEFVRAMVQELRSIVDRIMEFAGDNETIIEQCRELYDILDDIENGREPALTPMAGPSTENVIAMITELDNAVRENYGDDVADKIFSQADKELSSLFRPMLGEGFSASEFILGGSIENRESEFAIAGVAGVRGAGIPVDPKKRCAYQIPVPTNPGTLVTYHSDGTTSTASTGMSEECWIYLAQFLYSAYGAVVMTLIIAMAISDIGGLGVFIAQMIAAAFETSTPLLTLAGLTATWAYVLGVIAYLSFEAAASLWSFFDADCLGQLFGQSGDDGISVNAQVGGPARKIGQ